MNKTSDEEARRRILEELDTSFLVEAGAGSGKTTSLVGRLLALIETGTATVEQLAAITFTNKAADEMKERFRITLERRASMAQGDARGRLEAALMNLDRVFIGTIHAFCSSLLRERPIEAGIDPSFEELDQEMNRVFHDEVWDEYLVSLEERDSGVLARVAELGIDVGILKSVYDRVSEFTDLLVPYEQVPPPDFDLIRLSLLPMLEEAERYLPSTEPEKGWDTLQERIRSARRMLRLSGELDNLQMLGLAKQFEIQLKVTQNRWTDRQMAKAFGDKFHDWQITVLFPFLQAWREYLYPVVLEFVLPALDYCQERRLQAGKLNFQDLLLHARRLLRDYPEVRAFFAGRYQRLMVDEFQDTDPVQAEMMFLLTGVGEDPAERNWRKLTPRPGSLFVVGDPKQSIYRFRRADISIYNEVKARMEACGAVLHLTSNFRSVDAIGTFVNGQFVGKLPTRETEVQAAYVRMETNRPNPKGGKRASHGVFTLSYPKITGGKEAVAVADARRIASYIAWACRDGNLQVQEREGPAWGMRAARPRDFLILTKTKEFLHLYAEELERMGIAAETVGSKTLYPELSTLGSLVRLLADPSDQVALLSVLRGALFGLSDKDLLEYRVSGRTWSIYREPEEVKEDDPVGVGLVVSAMRRLRDYADWVQALPAWTALYRILEDTGLLPYASVQEAGANRAGTLLRLLEMLQGEALVTYDWQALTDAISGILKSQGLETASLYAGLGQAVRIMNVHKAKGLEAPIVFLACPSGESDHDAEQYVDRSKVEARGYFLINTKSGRHGRQKPIIAQPLDWLTMSERERAFMLAEQDRLLYVAATRAKQMLVVSLYPSQPANCPWTSLMDGMELARELEAGDWRDGVSGASVLEEGGNATQPVELAAYLVERRHVLERLRVPTYAQARVTELTKRAGQGETPEWSVTGRGQAFGSVVHKALEAIGKGLTHTEWSEYIRYLCQMEGAAEKDVPDALRMVGDIVASPLWQRSIRAKRRLFEVPMMLVSRQTDVEQVQASYCLTQGCDVGDAELLVKGVVDFAFEEEDGWVIVDFKTDQLDDGKLPSFIRYYSPQVQAYRTAWSESFGYPVKETGLYFATLGRYVRTEPVCG